VLGEDERMGASRFVFSRDRHYFVAARAILRCILAQYLRRAPSAVEFVYEPGGKPRLCTQPSIRFNLSHSRGLAVYAFSCNREIGIDVEAIQPHHAGKEFVERLFSAKSLWNFVLCRWRIVTRDCFSAGLVRKPTLKREVPASGFRLTASTFRSRQEDLKPW
jgi:hypothetical protein